MIRGVFATSPVSPHVNGALWTLRYEAFCYVLVGAAGAIGWWRGRAMWAWWAWLASWLVLALDRPPFHGAIVFTSAGLELVPTFIGGMAWSTLPDRFTEKFSRWPVLCALGAMIAGAYFAGLELKTAALLMPPFIVGLGRALPGRDMESRLGGDYSYGLYVGAYPLQQLLIAAGLGTMNLGAFFVLSLVTAGAYAIVSWHVIEAPALRLKHRRPWASFGLQFGSTVR